MKLRRETQEQSRLVLVGPYLWQAVMFLNFASPLQLVSIFVLIIRSEATAGEEFVVVRDGVFLFITFLTSWIQ